MQNTGGASKSLRHKKPRARTDATPTLTLPTCSGAGPSLDTETAATPQKFISFSFFVFLFLVPQFSFFFSF